MVGDRTRIGYAYCDKRTMMVGEPEANGLLMADATILLARCKALEAALRQIAAIDLTGDPVDASNAARGGVLIARHTLAP
jgi:hypothetical protein